jgi:hypothetical protein
MSGLAGYEKRLEQVGRTFGSRNAKTIVIAVPTQLIPIEGSVDSDAIVTEETRAAVDEILRVIGANEQDTLIEIARYTIGGPPELISVT